MEADAPLGRAPGGVVVDPPAGEDLDVAVVHPDRDGHLQDPLGRPEETVDVGIERSQGGGIVDPFEDGPPGVVGRGIRRIGHGQPGAVAGSPEFQSDGPERPPKPRWRSESMWGDSPSSVFTPMMSGERVSE